MTHTLRPWLRIAGLLLLVLAGILTGAAHADTITYFHNDPSGSPVAATDANGRLLWKETYRPYGERLLNGASPDANRLWFTGKPQDPDTGLSYLGARYYSPQLGRFMGIDPKAVDPADLHRFNRYAYANNNPYKFVDPDGRAAETVWDAFNIGLGVSSFISNVREGNYGSAGVDVAGVVVDSVAAVIPFVPGGAGSIIKVSREGAEVAAESGRTTSRAARREAMRQEGIPTSQQPVSQSKNASGREYQYEVPEPGGGTQTKSVQQQTMDSSHPGQGHWEAGTVKTDPATGEVRMNNYGRPKLQNDKSKVNYDD